MSDRDNNVIAFAKAWFKEMKTTKINVLKVCLESVWNVKPTIVEKSDYNDFFTLNPQSEVLMEVGEVKFIKKDEELIIFELV